MHLILSGSFFLITRNRNCTNWWLMIYAFLGYMPYVVCTIRSRRSKHNCNPDLSTLNEINKCYFLIQRLLKPGGWIESMIQCLISNLLRPQDEFCWTLVYTFFVVTRIVAHSSCSTENLMFHLLWLNHIQWVF